MSSYNLDETNQEESFPFTLGGHVYRFRYPTTEEVIELAKAGASPQDQDVSKALEPVYAFISSDDEAAPPIDEALRKSRVQVLKAFQNMIVAELGLQESSGRGA